MPKWFSQKKPHLETELMGGSPNGDDRTCMAPLRFIFLSLMVIQTYRLSIVLSPFVSAYSKQLIKESSNDVTIILLCL